MSQNERRAVRKILFTAEQGLSDRRQQYHRILTLRFMDSAYLLHVHRFEARSTRCAGNDDVVEPGVVYTSIFGVETAIFRTEIRDRDKSTLFQHGMKFSEHRSDIFDVMHRHRRNNAVELSVQIRQRQIHLQDFNVTGQLIQLGSQLLVHRRRNIDCGDFARPGFARLVRLVAAIISSSYASTKMTTCG